MAELILDDPVACHGRLMRSSVMLSPAMKLGRWQPDRAERPAGISRPGCSISASPARPARAAVKHSSSPSRASGGASVHPATVATRIPIARAPGFLKASDAMRFDPQCFPTGSPKRERGESAVKNRDHAAVFTGIGGRPSRHKTASDRLGYDALMPVSHPEMAEEPLTCLSFAPDRKEFLHVLVLRSSVIKTGWKNIDSQPG